MRPDPLLPKHRLEGITDGIFAVAMTLLVLDLRLPDDLGPARLADALLALLPRVDDYVISFLVLCAFWLAHVTLMRHLRAVDRGFAWLNLAFLLFTTFVPPLTAFADRHGTAPIAAVVYGANVLAILAFEAAMWRRALHGLADLPPSATARGWRRARRHFAAAALVVATGVAVGLVEIGLGRSTMVGPYVYLLLFAAGLPRPALGDGGADDDAGAR